MYAVRRLNVKRWDHQPAEERYSVQVARGGTPVLRIQTERITSIDQEVMYWRKANHIHAWFVDNVQSDQDDCRSHYVGWEKLRSLLAVCRKVIKASELVNGTIYAGTVCNREHPEGLALREPSKVIKDAAVARELLPTRAGLFFGSEEYDQDYLDDVVKTRRWIVSILEEHDAGMPGDIYYQSSW
jgi:hypothetical protein